jgi:hypothetical protein
MIIELGMVTEATRDVDHGISLDTNYAYLG